jgi:hypothetical protein
MTKSGWTRGQSSHANLQYRVALPESGFVCDCRTRDSLRESILFHDFYGMLLGVTARS